MLLKPLNTDYRVVKVIHTALPLLPSLSPHAPSPWPPNPPAPIAINSKCG